MSNVILDMTMSVDGYIALPDGDDGGLHHWVFGGSQVLEAGGMTFQLTSENSKQVFADVVECVGAFVIGRKSLVAGSEEPFFQLPTFVLTHTNRQSGDPLVHFVIDGIESALQQARAAANGKAVCIGGGADVAQQYLRAGLVDELHISLVPVIFGQGIRLFDNLGDDVMSLNTLDVVSGKGVTHIKYQIIKGDG
ncbi:dihydrofolate reductase [bacterium]|nr:dihydrofolate reductase [bacterium]